MRLFAYYALHSFVNQLRKLLKTWVLLFLLVCMVLGGVIGAGAAFLENAAEEQAAQSEEWTKEEADEGPSFPESQGVTAMELLELVLGAALLALFAYEAGSADKNGSKIFLPADVNLLFASPMSPQSVLMFRLSTQLGVALFSLFYFALQIPNLTLSLGLSLWTSLAMIGVWCLSILLGKLVQVLLYLLCSNHPRLKDNLRRGIWLLLGLVLGGFALYWRSSGAETLLQGAARYLNHPLTRWIPLWGWLKGIVVFVAESKPLAALLSFLGVLAAAGLLTALIRRTDADFYEDAMAKSEETAELLARARESNGLITGKRKKDRSDALRRDGLRHGKGASVFFHKTLYNRFRFAHLHFFTKTSETYLGAALLVSLLCRFGLETDSLLPVALTLAGLVFFRSLGNPLEEDTKTVYFLLIPESSWAKLLASLLGGAANCLLDLLPALLAAVLLGADPLLTLAWLPFLLSVDFYATATGAFINLSVPVSAGKTVKQLVQILFIYFGLLPDVGIIAFGLVYGWAVPAVAGSALLNILLGLVFFALTPLVLEPKEGKPYMEETSVQTEFDPKPARKQFSRLGIGIFVMVLSTALLQVAVSVALDFISTDIMRSGWGIWIAMLPQYLVGYPLALLLFRKADSRPPESRPCGAGRWLSAAVICVFLVLVGSLLGVLLNLLFQTFLESSGVNPVETLVAGDSLLIEVLVLVILAPVVEELFFRKALIDRMRVYGERLAVVTSAVIFGLIHGNVSQFFYALALGLVFGYLYLKTGRVRYSIILHMIVNFFGGIVSQFMQQWADADALANLDTANPEGLLAAMTPGNIALIAYEGVLLLLSAVGLITLIVQSRNIRFDPAEKELPRGRRFTTVWLNAGMILTVLVCLGSIAVYAFV